MPLLFNVAERRPPGGMSSRSAILLSPGEIGNSPELWGLLIPTHEAQRKIRRHGLGDCFRRQCYERRKGWLIAVVVMNEISAPRQTLIQLMLCCLDMSSSFLGVVQKMRGRKRLPPFLDPACWPSAATWISPRVRIYPATG